MVNLTQVILVVVITTLTILLTFIGIQVIYILRDLREVLKRVNKIVDNAEAISSAVVRPVTNISAVVEGIQSSLKIAELLGHFKKGTKEIVQELPAKAKKVSKKTVKQVKEIKAEVKEAKKEVEKLLPPTEPTSGNGHAEENPIVTSRSPVRRLFHRGGAPLA